MPVWTNAPLSARRHRSYVVPTVAVTDFTEMIAAGLLSTHHRSGKVLDDSDRESESHPHALIQNVSSSVDEYLYHRNDPAAALEHGALIKAGDSFESVDRSPRFLFAATPDAEVRVTLFGWGQNYLDEIE